MKEGERVIFIKSCSCHECGGKMGAVGYYSRLEEGIHYIKVDGYPSFAYDSGAFMLLEEFFNDEG
jgi:hypothetical protein